MLTMCPRCLCRPALQEARVHCNALPECKAISFAPRGRGNITTPVAAFKGGPGNEPIDLRKASLSGLTYLYVKDGYLPSSPAGTYSGDDGGGSSLSAGAIAGGQALQPGFSGVGHGQACGVCYSVAPARLLPWLHAHGTISNLGDIVPHSAGIVVGCASAAALAVLAIALVWRRRKARAVAGSGSGKPVSTLGSTVDPSGGASAFDLEAGTALQVGSSPWHEDQQAPAWACAVVGAVLHTG